MQPCFDLAPIVEISRKSFDTLYAINVAGTLFTLQAAAKSMIARGRGGKGSSTWQSGRPARRGAGCGLLLDQAAVISLTQSAGSN